ncbi:hypothetical protein QO021_28360 (plasmid) [Pseudomonas amygdali pv. lachrymans]|uniref:hypothetical protein n=1 Tax=Pseudomonas amygdali TaxID=47877 RepID=UPI0006BA07A3|nr:hypothetical protein [Pseudomonas amygdali]RMM39257.1 hypothetical protein ALQ79_200175 [Pseudomonas amygdali pv. lachrymans]WIO61472.1 hypothetical protein QO021_28360 [Pseudomonas amygdali pv. lachrymans]
MKHWLKTLLPNNASAVEIAKKIEDADERIQNLKEQIIAVQSRRSELEDQGRALASQSVDDHQLDSLAHDEAALLDSCKVSATILQGDLRRLFVQSTPFLGELAQSEMNKANSIYDNVVRWLTRV